MQPSVVLKFRARATKGLPPARVNVRHWLNIGNGKFGNGKTRVAESEQEPESESLGVVATSQESESESESIRLPRLRFQNVLLESVI